MKNLITVVILFLSLSVTLLSQINEFKIIPSDSVRLLGWSVLSFGNYAIVGAPINSNNGGAVYIFRKEGTNWIEEQKLTPSDSAAGYFFGSSVSISGDYIIVGAPQNDDLSGTGSSDSIGAAYVFRKEGAAWVEKQKLLASDGDTTDSFGYSVSISGDYIIIGAPRNSETKGAVYVFRNDGASWIEEQKLIASDGVASDYFGNSVSISGENILSSSFGSAYVFRREGTIWIEKQKIMASDSDTTDGFGFSASIAGNYIIIGAPGDDDSTGSAYIFREEGTNWVEEQKLKASNDTSRAFFGWSVSVSGDYAIVGSPLDDANEAWSGSAYIFKRESTNWIETQKLIASDGTGLDLFGWSVSISDDNAIVGAPNAHIFQGVGWGAAYIYNGFVVGVEDEGTEIPLSFRLEQNYPNPFNPSTTIRFTISDFGFTILKVYDVLGNEVATLVNKEKPAGVYEVDFHAIGLPSGVYFYRLQAGAFVETKKMSLIK
jgi:hypothetical protein